MALTTEEMQQVIKFVISTNTAPNSTLRICLPFKQTLETPYNQYDQLESYEYNGYNDTYVKEITYEDLCQVIRQLSKELVDLPAYMFKQYQSNLDQQVHYASCHVPKEVVDRALSGARGSGVEKFSFARKIELDVD